VKVTCRNGDSVHVPKPPSVDTQAMSTLRHIRSLLAMEESAIALESDNPMPILHGFRELANLTGQAYYVWNEGQGLVRMDVTNAVVPNTKNLEGALHAIADRSHFAVYLMIGVKHALKDFHTCDVIHDIVVESNPSRRKLILVDNELKLPLQLVPHFNCIRQRLLHRGTHSPEHNDHTSA